MIFAGISRWFHQQNIHDHGEGFSLDHVLHSRSFLTTRYFFFLYSLLFVRRIEHSWSLRCARARTEMKRKTNNRLQHCSCTRVRARVPSPLSWQVD